MTYDTITPPLSTPAPDAYPAAADTAASKIAPIAENAKQTIKAHPKEAAMAAGGLLVLLKLRKAGKKHRSHKMERKVAKIQHKLEKKAGTSLAD